MSEEITKKALECLMRRLDTDLTNAQAQKAQWEAIEKIGVTIIEKLGEILTKVIGAPDAHKKLPRPPIELTKEDLMFFAKKAPLHSLDRLIKDLSDVAKARQEKAPPGP